VLAGEGPTGVNKFQDVRSEGDVPVNCEPGAYCDVEDVESAGASAANWYASYPYAEGTTLFRVGSQSRTFMVVDDGGNGGWGAVGAGSTACVIQDPAAHYAPGQWAGYRLFTRVDGGGTPHHVIASNTATTITLRPDDCLPGAPFDGQLYHIGGVTGAAPPAWDVVKPGGSSLSWTAASGQGFTTAAGSGSVKVGSDIYARIAVGDYVVIPNADRLGVDIRLPAALIARVEAKTGGDTLTLNRKAGADVAYAYGYWGAPLVDHQISYIDLDFNALSGALAVMNSATAQGRTLGLGTVINYATSRPDWRRAGEPPPAGGVYSQLSGPVGHPLAATLTYAPVIDLAPAMDTADDLVLTPTGEATLDAPAPPPGSARELTLQIESAGNGAHAIRFGANFKSAGPLIVQGPRGAAWLLRFVSDGASWNEASRSGPDIADAMASGPPRQPLR
jgi:hypothetical protein